VNVPFDHAEKKTAATFAGPVSLITFGREQYLWHADRNGGIADPDGPGWGPPWPSARSRISRSPPLRYGRPRRHLRC